MAELSIAATYVINLADSTRRWQGMQPLLARIRAPAPIRFEAIDGAALGEAGLRALQAEGRLSPDLTGFDARCRPGEIGCALSHGGVLADIVARDLPAALILEDDIALDGSPAAWPARFESAFADLPDDWELWYLYRCFDIEHRAERITPRTVIPWSPQGGAAYAVTQAGARKLLSALTPTASAVDRVYARLVQDRGVRAFAASPLLIRPGRHPSVINKNNPSKDWVTRGVNNPPEYWPEAYLAHLGETAPVAKARRVYLVVWWFDRFGGMERHVTDLALALKRRGLAVTVFSETPAPRANQYIQSLRAAGIGVFAPDAASHALVRATAEGFSRLPLRRRRDDPSISATTQALLKLMERHVRDSPPDIVHVHGCRLGQRDVLTWASARGYPCVYTEHVTIGDWGGPFDADSPEIVAATADALACVSEYSRASLRACLPWSRKIHVTRHIVSDRRRVYSSARKDGEAAAEVRATLLAVGRLSAHKGYDTLLNAAALLRDAGLPVDVKIAGSGDQLAGLEALRQRLGLARSVTFLGQLSPEQIEALWTSIDIAVLPSLTEGLPLSVVEAMAQGRPIVASRVGGVPEVIEHEVSGLLVEPGDAVGLASAIDRIVCSPALAARLAAGARDAFEAGGWSEDAVTKQTLAIYDQAALARAENAEKPPSSHRAWAAAQAAALLAPLKYVSLFIWRLASFGDMEETVTQQAIALGRAGAKVSLFVETPVAPFNSYATRLREAGVAVIASSVTAAFGVRIAARGARRPKSTPLSRAFARQIAVATPDAVHIHGWRLAAGWVSLGPIINQARAAGISVIYTEHASDNGVLPLATDDEVTAFADVPALSASSFASAEYLTDSLGSLRPVAVMREIGIGREAPAASEREPGASFKVFALLPADQAAALAQAIAPQGVDVRTASACETQSEQIAACDAAVMSPKVDGYGLALAEAMASRTPVVICGDAAGLAIRHRANGLVADRDAAPAVLELAADPLLARQFASAARRTYELAGLQQLTVVGELARLYRVASRDQAADHARG